MTSRSGCITCMLLRARCCSMTGAMQITGVSTVAVLVGVGHYSRCVPFGGGQAQDARHHGRYGPGGRYMAKCLFRRRQLHVQGWPCWLYTPRDVFLLFSAGPMLCIMTGVNKKVCCETPFVTDFGSGMVVPGHDACILFGMDQKDSHGLAGRCSFTGLCVAGVMKSSCSSSQCRASSCPYFECLAGLAWLCHAQHVPGDDRRCQRVY